MLAHIDAVATVPFAFTSEITRLFQHPPLFSTSLTKSAPSRVFSFCFYSFRTHSYSCAVPLFFLAGDALQFSGCSPSNQAVVSVRGCLISTVVLQRSDRIK